jgi:hypothetical protein
MVTEEVGELQGEQLRKGERCWALSSLHRVHPGLAVLPLWSGGMEQERRKRKRKKGYYTSILLPRENR